MTLKKLNKRTFNSSYSWQEQRDIPEHVIKVRKLLASGFSQDECISWMINNTELSVYQVKCIVSSVLDNVVSQSGEEALDVYRTIKIALMDVLKTATLMYESATTRSDEADALKIKLKCLAQMRDLLPRQVQLENLNEETDNTRRLLFEIHGLSEKDITDIEQDKDD